MAMFNVNAWVEQSRGAQSDLIDNILIDKKFFAPNRPAAVALATADILPMLADFDPPYQQSDVTISVDQLQGSPL